MMEVLASLAITVALAPLARLGLRVSSEGESDIALAELILAGLIGALPAAFLSPFGIGSPGFLALVTLGALLPMAGWIDRKSGWAPDFVMLPIVVSGLVLGSSLGSWSAGPLAMLVWGAAGYAALQVSWILAAMKNPELMLPPPADLIALALPFLIFGTHPASVATSFAISVLLLLCKAFPAVNSLFSRKEVVEGVLKEVAKSDTVEASAITFLALAFPVTLIVLLLAIFLK